MYLALSYESQCVTKLQFSYFSTKTHVVGTQKNRLNETVLLSTQSICLNLWIKKYFLFYNHKFCLSKVKPMMYVSSLFLQKCVQNPKTKGMPLSSFLLKPMQRITKYPLIVEKVNKRTLLSIFNE